MRTFKTLFVIALFPCCIFAQTNWTYIGPSPGVWNDVNNWDLGTVPTNIGADDTVLAPFPSEITVDIDINNQGVITIDGAITNNATIDNFGQFSVYDVTNNATFANAGVFITGSFDNNLGFINSGSASCSGVVFQDGIFDNSGDFVHTNNFECNAGMNNTGVFEIEGYFTNGPVSTITNLGTINIDTGSNPISNNKGTINNFGTLSNEMTFTNTSTGVIDNDGTIDNDATFNNQGDIESNGVVKGTGELNQSGTFTHFSFASFEPGNSIGTITVNGDLNFGQATYKAEFDGANTSIDLIDVSGNIDLSNSSLDITWLTPPTSSGTYDLIQYANRTGQFSSVNIPALPDYLATINYTSNAVQLILTGIVPVGLTSFYGQQIKSDVKLEWVTSSEVNNKGFYVERRLDADSWESLDFIDGNDNTSLQSRYNYIDTPDQEGQYMYRLRQEDFDGRATYSYIISVYYTDDDRSNSLSEIQRSGSSNYYFEANTNGPIKFTLYNGAGQLLYFYEAQADELIDLSQFNTGMYFYSAQLGDDRLSGKLYLE